MITVKIDTTKKSFNEKDRSVTVVCDCGNHQSMSILSLGFEATFCTKCGKFHPRLIKLILIGRPDPVRIRWHRRIDDRV
jgi:hypothetical protein